MIKELKDKKPNIDMDVFIAESANIIGDVAIEQGSSIWFGASIRADMNYIKIGKYSNVQDNASIHVDIDEPVEIGDYTTVGHNAVVHGCTVGSNCLIGMGAIVLNGASIGDNSIIAAGTVVTEGTHIPANSLVIGVPGKVRKDLGKTEIRAIKQNALDYEKLWRDNYK